MKNWNKYLVAICLLFLMLPLSQVQAGLEPQALIESVANETLERVRKEKDKIKKDPNHINVLVNELVLPHFDFEKMSKWALGKYWRKAKKDQRTRFIKEFKSLLIRTYATSLSEYSDQVIKYQPFRGNLSSGDVTVRSEVEQPGGFPIPIDYKLHLVGGDWKAYDVKIDDISLIANYRTSFSKQIRKSGIDELIKKLADKND